MPDARAAAPPGRPGGATGRASRGGRGVRGHGGLGALRRRALQLALATAALAVVATADAAATGLLAGSPAAGARRGAALLVAAGHVAGGWGLGLALRLQLAPRGRVDHTLRTLLGVPACLLAAWPLASGYVPAALAARLPDAVLAAADAAAPFAAVALGLVLALGVVARRGR